MKKRQFMKDLYVNGDMLLQHEKYMVLKSCYKFNVEPMEWVRKADGDLHDQLGSLLFGLHLSKKDYLEMQDLYEKNKEITPFNNEKEEIEFHQRVAFNYCLNYRMRLVDLNKIDLKDEFEYDKNSIHNALNYLKDNKHPIIAKSWEKDLLEFLKSTGYYS